MLASLASDEFDEERAKAELDKIREDLDLTALEIDLLRSDDYASLNPGFWVVHLGAFRDEWQAEQACDTVDFNIPDCYTRRLARIGADAPVGYETGYLLAVLDTGALAVVDFATGEPVRIVEDYFYGDGSYPSAPSIRPGGTDVFYTVGYEDFWFSCDASDGTLVGQPLDGSEGAQIADGFSPILSPGGDTLVYLASSECMEDPNESGWVIAPIDTIVWRDLETGAETRRTLELTGDIAEYYEFNQLAWGPDGELLLMDTLGTLFRLSGEGAPEVVAELGEPRKLLVGWYRPLGAVLVIEQIWEDDTAQTSIFAVDPATGGVSPYRDFDGLGVAALDATGEHLVIAADGVLVADDVEVAIDYSIIDLSW